MKVSKKHLVIGGLVLLGFSLMSFASAKGSQAKEVFSNLKFKVGGLRRFDVNLNRIRFYLDLILQNPTSHDFSVSSGGVIKGRGYRVYRGDKMLTHGTLNNISNINLPPFGAFTLKDIYVEIPTLEMGSQVLDLVGGVDTVKNILGDLFSKTKTNALDQAKANVNQNIGKLLSELRYEIDIEALGQTVTYKGTVS